MKEWACRDSKGVVHEILVSVEGSQVSTRCSRHYFWAEEFGASARTKYADQLVEPTDQRVSCLFCLESR